MAAHFLASIYGSDYGAIPNATQGVLKSFSSSGTAFTDITVFPFNSGTAGATTMNGVTMQSVIEVLPTGLNQKSQKFFTSVAIGTLNTNSA